MKTPAAFQEDKSQEKIIPPRPQNEEKLHRSQLKNTPPSWLQQSDLDHVLRTTLYISQKKARISLQQEHPKEGLEYRWKVKFCRLNGSFREQGGLYQVMLATAFLACKRGPSSFKCLISAWGRQYVPLPPLSQARAQTLKICIRDHCWKTHNRLEKAWMLFIFLYVEKKKASVENRVLLLSTLHGV